MRRNIFGYICDHWQGLHPWALVLGVNLMVVQVLMYSMANLLGLAVFVLLVTPVVGWQVVGAIRAGRRYMLNSSEMFSALTTYVGLGFIVLLTLFRLLDMVSQRRMAAPMPVAKAPSLVVVEFGRTVLVSGPITYGLNRALQRTLAGNAAVQRVILVSQGGNIFAGRALARTIAEAALATRVEGACYSACTLAFMAGNPRILGLRGQLGFHGYGYDSNQRVQTLDVAKQEAQDRVYFIGQGVDPDFVDQMFVPDPRGLWIPTRSLLISAGVISK